MPVQRQGRRGGTRTSDDDCDLEEENDEDVLPNQAQADMFYSALRWAANLHDDAIELGFDHRRVGGHMQKLLIKHRKSTDVCRDPMVDAFKWNAFVEVETEVESELFRYREFSRRLAERTFQFSESKVFHSHMLDVFFRFYLSYEARKQLIYEETFSNARRAARFPYGPGVRSKWSSSWLDQDDFQLPVLSRNEYSPDFQLMPMFVNKWDITDPFDVNILSLDHLIKCPQNLIFIVCCRVLTLMEGLGNPSP